MITYQLRRTDKISEVLIKIFSKQKNPTKEIKFNHDKIEDYIQMRNREAVFEINS